MGLPRKGKYIIGACILAALMAGIMLGGLWAPDRAAQAELGPARFHAPPSFSDLVGKASPGVVNISAVKVIEGGPFPFKSPFGEESPFNQFFERFFRHQMPRKYRQKSLGSGFIIDKQGFILTNNHVVKNTEEIEVILKDESKFRAKVVGRDPKTDLALIRIKTDHELTPLPLGDSDKLKVGDWVIAIGNPFGLGNTVTSGIVSAKYRQIGRGAYDNFIQTDASINPGNSGGPLLNTQGEVVGINTAIFSQSGGSIGIGFAIPVNIAKDLLPQLKKGEVVRGWLGVMIQEVTPELAEKLGLKQAYGALVSDVTEGGPADKAGIKRGDVIISFDGKKVEEMHELPYMVGSTAVGKKVKVEVIRKGRKRTFVVELGELKEETPRPEEPEEPAAKIGMRVQDLTPELARKLGLSEAAGVVVVEVARASPAAEAGFRRGDVILEMDQSPVRSASGFSRRIRQYSKGDVILFLVNRRGKTLYLTMEYGSNH